MPQNLVRFVHIQNELNQQRRNVFGIRTLGQNFISNYIMCGIFWATLLAVVILFYVIMNHPKHIFGGKPFGKIIIVGLFILVFLVGCFMVMRKDKNKPVEDATLQSCHLDVESENMVIPTASNVEIEQNPPPYEWAVMMPITWPKSTDSYRHS